MAGKHAQIDQILTHAAERAPWAVLGYSPDLAARWKRDMKGFCAAVEQRRRDTATRAPQA